MDQKLYNNLMQNLNYVWYLKMMEGQNMKLLVPYVLASIENTAI